MSSLAISANAAGYLHFEEGARATIGRWGRSVSRALLGAGVGHRSYDPVHFKKNGPTLTPEGARLQNTLRKQGVANPWWNAMFQADINPWVEQTYGTQRTMEGELRRFGLHRNHIVKTIAAIHRGALGIVQGRDDFEFEFPKVEGFKPETLLDIMQNMLGRPRNVLYRAGLDPYVQGRDESALWSNPDNLSQG
jgi:hypothetical protein